MVSDREQHPEYFYAEYSGSPFKIVSSQTEGLPAGRAAYLLAQRGAFLPWNNRLAFNRTPIQPWRTQEAIAVFIPREWTMRMTQSMLANDGTEISHSLMEMSDEWLVVAAKHGNVDAFTELRTRHFRAILRTTYRITRNWEDAEDALQDSFLKAFLHLKSFEGRSSFSSWATRIAINISLMHLRKKRSNNGPSIDSVDHYVGFDDRWEIRDPGGDPERFCARYERAELLREAIRRLRPCLRIAVELRYSQEYSMKEIADSLGISLASAKSRLLRARLSLRTLLRDDNLRS